MIFRARASKDIARILDWYDERSEVSGDRLRSNLFHLFRQIESMPRLQQTVHKSVRRAVVPGFPYAVYYEILEEAEEILIYRVIHMHRDDRTWESLS